MKALILLILSGITLTVNAQKLKMLSGDVAPLRGQTSLNLKMDYSEMKFYNDNIDEKNLSRPETKRNQLKQRGRGE